MRKSALAAVLIIIALASGCASKGLLSGDTPGVADTFDVAADYQAAYRRASEYVRVCYERRGHPYGVVYQSRHSLGQKGAPNEIHVYKKTEPAKVLEIFQSQANGPSASRVTVRVLGEAPWDAAEVAAARTSIQSATPVCRQDLR